MLINRQTLAKKKKINKSTFFFKKCTAMMEMTTNAAEKDHYQPYHHLKHEVHFIMSTINIFFISVIHMLVFKAVNYSDLLYLFSGKVFHKRFRTYQEKQPQQRA